MLITLYAKYLKKCKEMIIVIDLTLEDEMPRGS